MRAATQDDVAPFAIGNLRRRRWIGGQPGLHFSRGLPRSGQDESQPRRGRTSAADAARQAQPCLPLPMHGSFAGCPSAIAAASRQEQLAA